jgi:hypothetical protein
MNAPRQLSLDRLDASSTGRRNTLSETHNVA